MTIWAIWDGDYGGDWIVAAFTTKELAEEYFRKHASGYEVRPIEVFDSIEAREAKETE